MMILIVVTRYNFHPIFNQSPSTESTLDPKTSQTMNEA